MLLPAAATLGILALVSVLFTSADAASNTYAANLGSQITTEVDGQYYVTLTAPDVNFSVSPSKNENAAKQRIDVGVETNVAGGAKLYLSMAGTSNSLHLNGDTTQGSPVIAAVSDGTDASSFPANTWGYSTDDQTYSAVPTTASDPALLANVDGETTGTTSGSVISASIPVYYAANVDTSIPAGSYSNRMTYSAVVDGGITAEATLTSIKVNGVTVQELQKDEVNTITVTTNLMVSSFGVPRVIYRTTDPSGYQECGNVLVQKDSEGYMAVTCEVTPTQPATGITLEIIPRGSEGDVFCADGTYVQGTSDCEEGAWKWGSFTAAVPNLNWRPENFDEIEIMQHMTPEICATASNGETKQLTDERDGKKYWVAKLADGNCWMTQNLDLNLNNRTLTPDDSDVLTNRSFNNNVTHTSFAQSNNNGAVAWAWDVGDYVITSYAFGNSCDSTTDLTECTRVFTRRTNQDTHRSVGDYYNFSAAVASSWDGSSSGTMQESICPKGWNLPTGNTNANGSYGALLAAYGYNNDSSYRSLPNSPLYLSPFGRVNPYYDSLGDAGHVGRYWTATGGEYHLYFTSNEVQPNWTAGSALGMPVRCLAVK